LTVLAVSARLAVAAATHRSAAVPAVAVANDGVASVFASAYEDSAFVAPLAYGLAGLSALSRINDDNHWLTDALVGGAIGIAIGKLVHQTSPFRPEADRRMSIRPYRRFGATGVQISLRF
jgi:hypothetical protein